MRFRVLGVLGFALGVAVRAVPEGTPGTEPTGPDQTSSPTNTPTFPTPSVFWGNLQSWTVCQPGKLVWVYTGPSSTTLGPVNLEIAVTNDGINLSDPDNDGDDDTGELTKSNFRRGIPNHLSASNTAGPTPTQSAISTVVVNGISPTQGAYTWNQVAIPAGFYKIMSTVTTDGASQFIFNSSIFTVQKSADTSCLTATPPTNPSNQSSSDPQSSPTNGVGSVETGTGSLATSKFNKPAVIGGSIIGGLVLIGALIAAFVFIKFSTSSKDVNAPSGRTRDRWNGLGSYDSNAPVTGTQSGEPQPKKKSSWGALAGLGLGAAGASKPREPTPANSSSNSHPVYGRRQTQSFPTSVNTVSQDDHEKYAMDSLPHEKSPFSDSGHNVVGLIPIGYNRSDYRSSQQLTPSEYGAMGRQPTRYSGSTSHSQALSSTPTISVNYSRPASTARGLGPSPSPQLVPFTPEMSSDDLSRASPMPTSAQQLQPPGRKMTRKPVPAYHPSEVSSSQSLPSSQNSTSPLNVDESLEFVPPLQRPNLQHKASTGSFTGREIGESLETGKMMYSLMPDPPLQR